MALGKYEVVGAMPIRDAVTKESVRTGGIVTLDDSKTLVAPLIQAGCVKPVEAKPKKD